MKLSSPYYKRALTAFQESQVKWNLLSSEKIKWTAGEGEAVEEVSLTADLTMGLRGTLPITLCRLTGNNRWTTGITTTSASTLKWVTQE